VTEGECIIKEEVERVDSQNTCYGYKRAGSQTMKNATDFNLPSRQLLLSIMLQNTIKRCP
jgi:hypothetical protein